MLHLEFKQTLEYFQVKWQQLLVNNTSHVEAKNSFIPSTKLAGRNILYEVLLQIELNPKL